MRITVRNKKDINHAAYKISRIMAVFMFCFITLRLVSQNEFVRVILNSFLYLIFVFVSLLYEKKRKYMTVGYVFIYIILFMDNTICAAYYTKETIYNLHGKKGFFPSGYYGIYFGAVLVCYLVIILYLIEKRNRIYVNENNITLQQSVVMQWMLMSIPLIFLYKTGISSDAIIPVYAFLFSCTLLKKKSRLLLFLELCFVILITGWQFFEMRFLVIQIAFPVIWICFAYFRSKHVNLGVIIIMLFGGFFLAGAYGVISEIIKLNVFYNADYDIFEYLNSFNHIIEGLERQIYRLFGIWIKTGGYIIYHVRNNRLYFGLTYIKALANTLHFPYISLPQISAVYNQSTYAQPGLLAEGYANFGIIGSVINICCVFFVCEFFSIRYLKKPTFSRLFFSVVPFTKILLDGGTLNSAISLILFCFIWDLFHILANCEKSNDSRKGIRMRYKNCKVV